MKFSTLASVLILILTGCASHDDDNVFYGTYSNCSYMTDVQNTYSFMENGEYYYEYIDDLGGATTYNSGTWELTNDDTLILRISKIGQRKSNAKDTTNLTKKIAISYDGNCIYIGIYTKLCKGGTCFN